MFKNVVVGLVCWLLIALVGFDHLGVISIVLLSGPLVAVPLALPFVIPAAGGSTWTSYWIAVVPTVAACFAPQPWAWILTLPWLAFAVGLTVVSTVRLYRERNVPSLLVFGASAYLIVAASWLLASQSSLQLMGFREPIVKLTSAHFHFAGFASAVIASHVAVANGQGKERKLAAASAILVGGAPLTVAIGHLVAPSIELTGGAVTSVGLLFLAVMTWRAPVSNRVARGLVRYCSFPLILTMALALQYGLGRVTGEQALNYEVIAAIHGGLNALVFSCGSLLGWRIEALAKGPENEKAV